ncbi:MAG: SMP-30/gluconolactonase/LRE family protein, partial [Limisphaerales bacterium]
PELPGNRFNDAKCDPSGNLWAGTMAVDETPAKGSLYRIGADQRATRKVTEISISNGLAWSADRRTMYYIDSPTRRVDAFDFDVDTGGISRRRTVVEITDGYPDGMSIDERGNLWIAIWGGGCVACHEPDGGRRIARIEIPVRDVTSCCFGSGDTLFITTAGRDVVDADRHRQPLAGGLFKASVGVTGPVPPDFQG